jgi:hypothetical protein
LNPVGEICERELQLPKFVLLRLRVMMTLMTAERRIELRD